MWCRERLEKRNFKSWLGGWFDIVMARAIDRERFWMLQLICETKLAEWLRERNVDDLQ